MKGIKFIRGQPRSWGILQSHTRKFHWTHVRYVVTVSVPLVSSAYCARSLLSSSVSSGAFVMRSPPGVNHNVTTRTWLLSSPSFVDSQTWVSSTTRGQRLTFRGQPPYLIQWVGLQGWSHLRANPGFEEFWFIPPLLVVAYLPPTSFIGRISPFFPE